MIQVDFVNEIFTVCIKSGFSFVYTLIVKLVQKDHNSKGIIQCEEEKILKVTQIFIIILNNQNLSKNSDIIHNKPKAL